MILLVLTQQARLSHCSGEAPIKETLAASLIRLANWNGTPLIDPFCGSAPLLSKHVLLHKILLLVLIGFVSEQWNMMPPNIYDKFRDEADQLADYDKDIQVYASDIDPEMIEIAKRNAEEVGLGDIIQFNVKDVNTLSIDTDMPVALVGNPPYGERIGDREEVEEMYRYMVHF